MLLILPLILPIAAALLIWALPRNNRRLTDGFAIAALAVSALCALAAALKGDQSLTLWRLTDTIAIQLRTDGVARFYMAFISVVWVLVGIYATAYNAHDPNYRRFN